MQNIFEVHMDITTVSFGVVGHGVNCQGVMGSGVAKAIRDTWPEIFKPYSELVTTFGSSLLGTSQIIPITNNSRLFVANMFTQDQCGNDGQVYASVDAIASSVLSVIEYASALDVDVYLPKIGSGLGGLDWERDCLPKINNAMKTFLHNNTEGYVPDIIICCVD